LNYNEQIHIESFSSPENNTLGNISMQSANEGTTVISEVKFDIDRDISSFYESAIEFIVSLHNNNNFTKKDVINVQSGIIQNLISPIVSILKNVIKNEVKEPLSLSKFNQVVTAITNPFKFCNSEYSLLNWLVGHNLVSEIKLFNIHNEICPVQHMGELAYDEKQTKGALLPIKLQFKKYFEHGDNFIIKFNKLKKLQLTNSFDVSNFVQGKFWKQKISNHSSDKIIIPFFLYIDDAEINNPLGSYAICQQILAIYYNFPLAENNSKLDKIFLTALIKSIDLKQFGNDLCLQSLVNEINT